MKITMKRKEYQPLKTREIKMNVSGILCTSVYNPFGENREEEEI